MFFRLVFAVCIGLPLITVFNIIGYWITLITLVICFGCFAPQPLLELLATLEFVVAMLFGVLQLTAFVLTGDEAPR